MSDLQRRLLLAHRLGGALDAPPKAPAPPPPRETVVDMGLWWTVWSAIPTRPYERFELDYSRFRAAPDVTTLRVTWVPAQSKWAVRVNGQLVHDGENPISVPGLPNPSTSDWNFHQVPNWILGFVWRTYASTAALTWFRLEHVEGMPAFGGIGVGTSSSVTGGSGGSVSGNFYVPPAPGTTARVPNILFEPYDLEGPRVRILGQGGQNYDGLVFHRIQWGTTDDETTNPGNQMIAGPSNVVAGQERGVLVFDDCYFRPAPFTDAPTGWQAKFRSQRWGIRTYNDRGLVVRNCKFGDSSQMRLWEEHCIYISNPKRFVFIENNDGCITGRTFVQVTNRMAEFTQAMTPGWGPVVVIGNQTDGGAWPNGAPGGGSTFTIAGHTGPVAFDGNRIRPMPALSAGTWNRRGGGMVLWYGGSHVPSGTPTLADGVTPWPVSMAGDNTFLTPSGFAIPWAFLGRNELTVDTPNGMTGEHAFQCNSVEELLVAVGPGAAYLAAGNELEFDHTQGGNGNADIPPPLQYDGVTRTLNIEARRIALFDSYVPGSVAPSVASAAASCFFPTVLPGAVVKRPAGSGLAGTTITSLPWEFLNPAYL